MISALYIHVPFCRTKCDYCSFASFPGLKEIHKSYVHCLKKELHQIADQFGPHTNLKSVFIGGGTPTTLAVSDLAGLLGGIRNLFDLEKDTEISLEANPGTVDLAALLELREAGYNRISFGVQSFSDKELRKLGRCHTGAQAAEAVYLAREAGFDNLSLDLMYGQPDQSLSQWRSSLEQAVELNPQHLSLYQLTVEDDTPFFALQKKGELQLPVEETILAIDSLNERYCGERGLAMYEISNYAREGFWCRHNINYWHNNDYLAAGAGAVSYTDGCRGRRIGDPRKYCQQVLAGKNVIVEQETLTREESFRETMIMGLRLNGGISLDRLGSRFGIDPIEYYGETLSRLVDNGVILHAEGHLRLTHAGRKICNTVLAELV